MQMHRRGVTRAWLIGISRALFCYQPRRGGDAAETARLVELAGEKRRYGYQRLHVLLRREGIADQPQANYRLYRDAAWPCGASATHRAGGALAIAQALRTAPNVSWSMDFVADGLANGRRLRI